MVGVELTEVTVTSLVTALTSVSSSYKEQKKSFLKNGFLYFVVHQILGRAAIEKNCFFSFTPKTFRCFACLKKWVCEGKEKQYNVILRLHKGIRKKERITNDGFITAYIFEILSG